MKNKYYWYQVKYLYKDKDNLLLFEWQTQVGLTKQSTILDKRELKKITNVLQVDKKIKRYLCNGLFDVEIICFLGRFSSR